MKFHWNNRVEISGLSDDPFFPTRNHDIANEIITKRHITKQLLCKTMYCVFLLSELINEVGWSDKWKDRQVSFLVIDFSIRYDCRL